MHTYVSVHVFVCGFLESSVWLEQLSHPAMGILDKLIFLSTDVVHWRTALRERCSRLAIMIPISQLRIMSLRGHKPASRCHRSSKAWKCRGWLEDSSGRSISPQRNRLRYNPRGRVPACGVEGHAHAQCGHQGNMVLPSLTRSQASQWAGAVTNPACSPYGSKTRTAGCKWLILFSQENTMNNGLRVGQMSELCDSLRIQT